MNKKKVFRWTEEAEKKLLELYQKNLSLEEVCKALSQDLQTEVTRFMVLKKLQSIRERKQKVKKAEGVVFKRYVFSSDKDFFFVSDLHVGEGEQEERVKKLIEEIKKRDSAVFFLGDLLQSETLHSKGSPFGKQPSSDLSRLIDLLDPIREKVVAFVSGNHEDRVEKLTGLNPIRDFIAPSLSADFFPDALACYVKTPSSAFRVFAIHGNGYSRRVGGKLNRLEDLMQIAVADVYVTAHSHLPAYFNLRRVEIESDRIALANAHFINCASFQKYAGYSVKKAFVPTGTFIPILKTKPFSVEFVEV